MCIIKIRRADPLSNEEAPVVVPIRPVSRGQLPPPSPRANAPTSPRGSRLQQQPHHPRASAGSQGSTHRRTGSQQQIVIASPRTSRPKMSTIQHGSSYSYGSGPVPAKESLERVAVSGGGQQRMRSYSGQRQGQQQMGGGRRSTGSVTFDKSPRASHVSHRSTREKIVIVDEMGRRRESGFH
ncbi:MAG: hypothetical protein LQ338_003127 [Usnochroma carphineum]|nr:MAG: hypothetical protein LQ338_003127 [Usnochroma carphineum]